MSRINGSSLPADEQDQLLEGRFRWLAEALTGADERLRQAVLEQVCSALPAIQTRVAHGLVETLNCRSASERRQAAASLVRIGELAVAALMIELCSSGRVAFRVRLAKVLGGMGVALDPD